MRNREKILELVKTEKEPQKDLSLQAKARKRAMESIVPRTLTPWEWQEWYERHGVPESHSSPTFAKKKRRNMKTITDWFRQFC